MHDFDNQIYLNVDSLFISNLYKVLETRTEDKVKELLTEFFTKISLDSEKINVLNELARISITKKNHKMFKIMFEDFIQKFNKECNFDSFFLVIAKYDDNSSIFSFLKNKNLIRLDSNKLLFYLKALKIACLNNHHAFIQNLFIELDSVNSLKECFTVDLVKESCKYINCFQEFYYTNRNDCFKSNEILKYCLKNKYMDTFWFILTQSNDNFELIKSNLDWKSGNKTLVRFVLDETKYINQEIINFFEQLYEINLFDSLFFVPSKNDSILRFIEEKKEFLEILKYLLEKRKFLNKISELKLKLNSDNIILNSCFSNDLVVKLSKSEYLKRNLRCENSVEMITKRNELKIVEYFINSYVEHGFKINTIKNCIQTIVQNNNETITIRVLYSLCMHSDHEYMYLYLEEFYRKMFEYDGQFANGTRLIIKAYKMFTQAKNRIEHERQVSIIIKKRTLFDDLKLHIYLSISINLFYKIYCIRWCPPKSSILK